MQPPKYFREIKEEASTTWNTLEAQPEIAAPWHQLFSQVANSPRNVLSELLQNADDAGADEASAEASGDEFILSHNGADFNEEQFRSLCRFGFSNKRALHTIGFRGIGFKSTFSIGDEIRLYTPTLAVAFRRKRFTEPVWIGDGCGSRGNTEIRITIKDDRLKPQLKRYFEEWIANPTSLLFFKTIRVLTIMQEKIHWVSQGSGPVANSEWMARPQAPDDRYLHIWSDEQEFPPDSLQEIREERMALDQETTFPPCKVELVMGHEGRLFVVLYTGVKTSLPFACNAPFIPDPARLKIKGPEVSPTNRWLLERIGKLAGSAVLAWLSRDDVADEERAQAYALWPDVDRDDDSLEGACAAAVELAFQSCLEGTKCLLSENGELEPEGGCVALPMEVMDTWEHAHMTDLFENEQLKALSRYVSPPHSRTLKNWGYIKQMDRKDIVAALETRQMPKPRAWRQLMLLWDYVCEEVDALYRGHKAVKIVPVQGQEVLYSASEVVRLSEDRLLKSGHDWRFLSDYLLVMNQNWTNFLAEQRLSAGKTQDMESQRQVTQAYRVLESLSLHQSTDAKSVMERVSSKFFARQQIPRCDCVRIAHIAAALGAVVPDTFRFVTCDETLTLASFTVVADINSDLDLFVGDQWYKEHVLHKDYSTPSATCSATVWREWVRSEGSRLLTFVPVTEETTVFVSKARLLEYLRLRMSSVADLCYHYKYDDFRVIDLDFDESLWRLWHSRAEANKSFWIRLLKRILAEQPRYWDKKLTARAFHVGTTGRARPITSETIVPEWIVRLRELPCLEDTAGRPRQPAELMRRTPQTEPMLGVEPFVDAVIDNETNRPILQLLGVKDTPTSAGSLIDRLRALAQTQEFPPHEVLKWYQGLDQILNNCGTEQLQVVRETFELERITLADTDGVPSWVRLGEVYLAPDEDVVPGASLVHPLVRYLALWRKLDIADRPTEQLAMSWLASLPSGQRLSSDEMSRVKGLIPRYAERIWTELGHWIDLDGNWRPVESLAYAVTMQSLVTYSHLFPAIKHQTANLQYLNESQSQQYPFCAVPRLMDIIEDRHNQTLFSLGAAQVKPWLHSLGVGLTRVVMNSDDETQRVRSLGRRLAATSWQMTSRIQVVPYIGGTPAGSARSVPALWDNTELYVAQQSEARVAREVPRELGKAFENRDISDAILICYDRSAAFVTSYLEANLKLAPMECVKGEEVLVSMGESGAVDESSTAGGTGEDRRSPAEDREASGVLAGSSQELEEDDEEHQSDDEEIEPGEGEEKAGEKPAGGREPRRPPIIARYARANGYSPDGEGRYCNGEGAWLERSQGTGFHWEKYSRHGELVQYYWLKDHCLEREPLQIAANVWDLCEQHPDLYAIILVGNSGDPEEISGHRLVEMRDEGRLELAPASYRMVYR